MNLQVSLRKFPQGLWQQYLVLGGVLTIAYYLALPAPPLRAIFYTLIDLSALVAISYNIYRGRAQPSWTWPLIGLGILLYFLGDATYNYYRFFLHVPRPFPSIADIFFLSSHVALFAGLVLLARAPGRRRNAFSLLDTIILAAGMSLIWWTLLMAPQAYNPNFSPLERFIATAGPAMDFLLAAAGLRLALVATKRTPAQYMVGGALVGLLGADIIYTVLQLNGIYQVGTWIDLGWIWFYLLFGAASLYPQAETATPDGPSEQIVAPKNKLRLSLLMLAALLFPATLLLSDVIRNGLQDPVLILLGTILIILVVFRLYLLMQANLSLQVELARLKSDVLFRSIVERAYSGVSLLRPDLSAQYHSPNVYKIAAIAEAPDDFRQMVHPDDRERFNEFWVDTLSQQQAKPIEYRIKNPTGGWADVETMSNNLLDDEWISNIVLITRDISARKQHERQLNQMAYADTLTGLPNRAALNEQLKEALVTAKENDNIVGIMFLDLDNFSAVNDNFGHTVGDGLLVELARRLDARLYEGETLARFGGDEFMIVSGNLREPADAHLMHQRISSLFGNPFQIESYQIYVTACTGIALSEEGITADDLLRNADLALHQAKTKGQGAMRLCTRQLLRDNQRRHALSSHLRDILFNVADADAVQLAFQPIVNLSDRHLARIEATPHWHHPDYGNILMDELSDVAHGSDLLAELEARTLNQACEILHDWKPLMAGHPLRASINITAASFGRPNFEHVVAQVLIRYGLSPSLIAMEITERALIGNEAAAFRALEGLADIGVEVIIDHFGRDYSSITQLQRIQHAAIKLDRTLVESLDEHDSALMVHGLVQVAHDFNRLTIADGIETAKQAEAVLALGCDYGQGEYFGKSITASQMERRLKSLTAQRFDV